jgi:hypothetical protein
MNTELLQEILEWYQKVSAPNSQYAYHRCHVCDATWWGDAERHNLDCWIPRLQHELTRVGRERS